MPAQTTAMGKYMYCLIRCSQPRQFATRGIGERGDIVYTIGDEELAAVVSDSPVMEYDCSRRNMMAHTLVLEEVMKEYTILPIRFDTVAPDAESIQVKLLKRRGEEIRGHLQVMDGRLELGLKAFWYEEVIFREIVEENPPIRQLRDSLAGRPSQQSYQDRMRLGEMVAIAVEKKREADAEKILACLRPFCVYLKTTPAVSDRMILNAAFLVDKPREPEFDLAVQQLDAEMGYRVMFKYVDQVPPYNFVNFTLNWKE